MVQKQLIFNSKWTTVWDHGVQDALLNTHLQSFDSPIAMEEERPSLETLTWECHARSAHTVQSFGCRQILEP